MAQILNSTTPVVATIVGTYVDPTTGNTVETTVFPETPVWSVAAGFVATPSADGLTVSIIVADPSVSAAGQLTVRSGSLIASADLQYDVSVAPAPAPSPAPAPATPPVATAIGIRFL